MMYAGMRAPAHMRETRRGRERYDVTFDKRNKVRASQRVVVCMVGLNASVIGHPRCNAL